MITDAIKRWNRRRLEKKRQKKIGANHVSIHAKSLSAALGQHIERLGPYRLVVGTRLTQACDQLPPDFLRAIFAALDALPPDISSTVLIASAHAVVDHVSCEVIQTTANSELEDVNAVMQTARTRGATHVIWVSEGCIIEPFAVISLLRVSAGAKHQALVDATHFPIELPKTCDPNTLATPWVSHKCLLIPHKGLTALKGFDTRMDEEAADIDLSSQARTAGLSLMSCPTALICDAGASAHKTTRIDESRGLSVVVRFHDSRRLSELKRCLFSIACSTYPHKEAVVVCQSFGESELSPIKAYAAQLNKARSIDIRIINPSLPKGIDHRSALLNTGITAASGRYLAFLDYDDCIHPQAYAKLIDATRTNRANIAFGDIAIKKVAIVEQATIVRSTIRTWTDRNLFDLLYDNCCPIHSYVIDRQGISEPDLRFDETLSKYEDYDFLIKVCSQYRSDFSLIGEVIGDYYIKEDGSNSVITASSFSSSAKNEWQASKNMVYARRDQNRLGQGAHDQINRMLHDMNMPALKENATVHDVNKLSARLRKLK